MDRAFSALDIARLLVRNPDEVMEWPTYDRICDQFCRGRALENLSRDEKDAIFSFEVGVTDLIYLGFSKDQVQIMVDAFQEAYDQVKNVHYTPDLVGRDIKERVYLTAYTAAAFPYGPPIILSEPYNVMAKQQFSLTQARTYMTALQRPPHPSLWIAGWRIATCLFRKNHPKWTRRSSPILNSRTHLRFQNPRF